MTVNSAIQTLNVMMCSYSHIRKSDQEFEAMSMAIEALEELADNEPFTIEQLREMDGQPVWGKSIISGKPGEWFVVRVIETDRCWFIACAGSSQGFGDKETYGKTWLAYPHPHKSKEE